MEYIFEIQFFDLLVDSLKTYELNENMNFYKQIRSYFYFV